MLRTPMPTRSKPPRKKGVKKRPMVRGEPVVRSVLNVTLDTLAETGFASLRVEDVAARAGVNKTTIYRRWPTKDALVRAALLTVADDDIRIPDTGSLRGDLLAIGRMLEDLSNAPRWQSVIRMILAEGPDSDLAAIAQSVRESYEPLRRERVNAAIARGEVADFDDGLLLLEVFDATLHFRLFVSKLGVDKGYLESLVGFLLDEPKVGRKASRAVKKVGARRRAR